MTIDKNQSFVSFEDSPHKFCICMVDIMKSTDSVAKIFNDSLKLRKYYSLFLNTMGKIVTNYNGNILKNAGDSIIFYFPKTSDLSIYNKSSFIEVLECGLTMTSARCMLNQKAHEEKIPPIYFRISAVYGKVETAKSLFSPDLNNLPIETRDLFGHVMNVCSKINTMAPVNSMVVGEDFCQTILSLFSKEEIKNSEYLFQEVGEYQFGLASNKYKVFCVLSKYARNQNNKVESESINKKEIHTIGQDKAELVEQAVKHYNILLVEDDVDVMFTYKLALDAENFNVDAFSDSNIALRCFAEHPVSYYDIVILDIRMPNLNGIQLFYRLKSIDTNVKILFVSALDAAPELTSILPGIKFDDLIRKPVNINHLIHKIRTTIET